MSVLRGMARALVCAALLVLAGCHARLKGDLGLTAQDARYEALYPYYAELCAESQFRKKPGTGIDIVGGGFGGHAVLYLNGVCRVKEAGYPVLRLCAGGGVGLSVNDHYKNANWIATEGRDFFFYGLLKPGEKLTPAVYDATVRRAQAMRILDGIVYRDVYLKAIPRGMAQRDYMYQVALGTDFALSYARDRYCGRVPLTRAQMEDAVRYLNAVNAPYRAGEKTFEWNVMRNNCSHLYHNALAAAGVWADWPTGRSWLGSALRFPTPKNEFVNLVRRVNDLPLGDLDALYADPALRGELMTRGRLPAGPGGLVALERMAQDNAIYDTDVRLIFYDDPTFGPYLRHYRRILAEPRYRDLAANLRYFRDLYAKIEAQRKPLRWYWAANKYPTPRAREDFSKFYMQYYRAIARQRAALARDLAYIGER